MAIDQKKRKQVVAWCEANHTKIFTEEETERLKKECTVKTSNDTIAQGFSDFQYLVLTARTTMGEVKQKRDDKGKFAAKGIEATYLVKKYNKKSTAKLLEKVLEKEHCFEFDCIFEGKPTYKFATIKAQPHLDKGPKVESLASLSDYKVLELQAVKHLNDLLGPPNRVGVEDIMWSFVTMYKGSSHSAAWHRDIAKRGTVIINLEQKKEKIFKLSLLKPIEARKKRNHKSVPIVQGKGIAFFPKLSHCFPPKQLKTNERRVILGFIF